jgi:hypothetical protein
LPRDWARRRVESNQPLAGFVPAVGCAGNAWIPASVYGIILNIVDGGLSAQQAIERRVC